jgi:hypothetical protein
MRNFIPLAVLLIMSSPVLAQDEDLTLASALAQGGAILKADDLLKSLDGNTASGFTPLWSWDVYFKTDGSLVMRGSSRAGTGAKGIDTGFWRVEPSGRFCQMLDQWGGTCAETTVKLGDGFYRFKENGGFQAFFKLLPGNAEGL